MARKRNLYILYLLTQKNITKEFSPAIEKYGEQNIGYETNGTAETRNTELKSESVGLFCIQYYSGESMV